jgi:uncharacterized lipoprotein YmbA
MRVSGNTAWIHLRALVLLALAACASRGLVAREYVLTPVATPASAADSAEIGLGVGPIELPDYLRRPQIVSRQGNRLEASDAHRWGADLQSDFARVLAENLSMLVPTRRVAIFPWVDVSGLDYRVEVQVSQFEPVSGGAVLLAARWRLIDVQSGDGVHVARSSIREPVGDGDHAARVAGMSRAIGTLSREIALVVQQQRGG